MNSYALGARLGFARLRSRTLVAGALVALAVVIVVALLERAHDRSLAVDRTLAGAAFGLCLPLFCFGCFELAATRGTLKNAVAALARHGRPGPMLASGLIGSVVSLGAAAGVTFAGLAVLLTRDFDHSRMWSDFGSVLWIGALTGAAYAGLFAAGSGFRRGRLWLLVADWLFGSGTGLLAMPWPRSHARNLLGFEPVLELTQTTAAFALLIILFAGFYAATRGVPR